MASSGSEHSAGQHGEPNLSGANRAADQLDRDDNLLSEDKFDALMDGAPQ